MSSHHDEKAKQAQQELTRLADEGDNIGRSSTAHMAKKFADRMNAKDINPDDGIELWGTRIGRILGLIVFIALAIYLIFEYIL